MADPDTWTVDSTVVTADSTAAFADNAFEKGPLMYLALNEVVHGTVLLSWPSSGSAPPDTYNILQNGVVVQSTGFSHGAATISGLLADTSYTFKIVAISAGVPTFQSPEQNYRYDSRASQTVTLMRRVFPFPSTGQYRY